MKVPLKFSLLLLELDIRTVNIKNRQEPATHCWHVIVNMLREASSNFVDVQKKKKE